MMRTVKLLVMAMLFAFTTGTLAHAGSQILKNQSTTIKAAVKNNTTKGVLAAVKLTGYDDTGVAIGKLCKSVYLGAGRTTTVEYPWQAPNYGTGVYWSSKVEVNSACPSATTATSHHDDDDDHDDDDHDDNDHDDDEDDRRRPHHGGDDEH
jgi:hypothetical protein